MTRRHVFGLSLLLALAAPTAARAWLIESIATAGCHERLTRAALAQTGWPDTASIGKPSGENAGLADALAFTVGRDSDEWLIAVLIGARDNDLRGAGSSDFMELSALHNAPEGQEEHCLRAPWDDEAPGDRAAVDRCRAYLRTQVGQAMGGVDGIDLAARDTVLVALRDQTRYLELPRYPLQLGRALHALQDSFTHTYRTEDFRSITTVFNYADPATAPAYEPLRDGVAHRGDLDTCDEDTERESKRVAATVQASAELMAAVAADGTRAERLARADGVLARWLQLQPGCGPDDGFCGSEEPVPQGCTAAPGAPLLALGLCALRSRRRAR